MNTKDLIKEMKNVGWYEVRQKGSHKTFKHDNYNYLITVPFHGQKHELGKGLQNSILRKAGIKK